MVYVHRDSAVSSAGDISAFPTDQSGESVQILVFDRMLGDSLTGCVVPGVGLWSAEVVWTWGDTRYDFGASVA